MHDETPEELALDRYAQNDYEFTEQDGLAFPHLVRLRARLLSVGGQEVDLATGYHELPFAEETVREGRMYSREGAEFRPGRGLACYQNSKDIVLKNPGLRYIRGWALSPSRRGIKVWKGHAWIYDPSKNAIIETTLTDDPAVFLRDAYFGADATIIEIKHAGAKGDGCRC